MNKLLRALLAALLFAMIAGALAEEPAGTPIPFETSIELNDGAGNPVATLETRAVYGGAERQVTVAYTLTNHGERALTQLNFNVGYFDADGNAVVRNDRVGDRFSSNQLRRDLPFFFYHPHGFQFTDFRTIMKGFAGD